MNPAFVAFAVIACIAAIAYAVFAETSAQTRALDVRVVPAQYEVRLVVLDREAIEAAYRQHVTALFLVWMKDSSGQPARALIGVNQARAAYAASMDAIDQRERAGR
jgi:hypothetical protein